MQALNTSPIKDYTDTDTDTDTFSSPPPLLVIYNTSVMRDMLEPMSAGEFFADYYMQEPVHIHRVGGIQPYYFI